MKRKKLSDRLLRVLHKIKEVDGISTKELVESLGLDYSAIRVTTRNLWERGLIGELYGTWTTNREEATEGEFVS